MRRTLGHSCCTIHLFLVLCGRLTHVATDAGLTSPLPTTSSPTHAGTFSPTTTQEPFRPNGTPEAVPQDPASSTTNTNPTTGTPEAVPQDPVSSTTNTNPSTGTPESVPQDPVSSTTNTNPTTGTPEAVPQDPVSSTTNPNPTTGTHEAVPQDPVSSTTNPNPTTGTPEAVPQDPVSSTTNKNLTSSDGLITALSKSIHSFIRSYLNLFTTSAPGGISEKQRAFNATGTPEVSTQDPASSTASTNPTTGTPEAATRDPASSTASTNPTTGTPEAATRDPASSTASTNPTTGTPEAATRDPASSTASTNPTTGTPEAATRDPASSTASTNPTTGTPEAATRDPASSTASTNPTTGTPEAATRDPASSTASTNPTSTGTPEAATRDPASSTASTNPTTGTPEAATRDPASSTASTNLNPSDAPTAPSSTTALATEAPIPTTTKPVLVMPEVCLCDLTPDFCDLGCCCDVVDCGVFDLRTVFTGCEEKPISGVCVEKWLMFTANVDPALVTVSDALFCVRPAADNTAAPRALPALSQNAALLDSYHFSPPQPATAALHTRGFYRVDDVILTYFDASSLRGVLRQPSPGPASSSCINRNPAKFLRSVSLTCSRSLTPESCASDPSLSAASYSSDLSLFKLPAPEALRVTSDLLIPVSPAHSGWPTPREQNGSCLNVVSQVEFVIRYTSRGELTEAVVNVVLADVDADQALSQKHSVQFQLATPRPTPGPPILTAGLRAGSPVIGRFGGTMLPLTVLGVSPGGRCSADPGTRAPLLFTHNTVAGCFFSSPSSDCYELRSELYEALQGAVPDLLAMSSGPQPDWTRVVTQRCALSPQETCESGCLLPRSLSIQVLWARQGLLDQPHSYILGAKYLFLCHRVQCPLSSPLTVTTEVRFVDTTVYPEAPRGSPQPTWRFPFGFFSRGAAELDGQTASAAAGVA